MSFDVFAIQKQILDRLEPICGDIPLVGKFGWIDLTDDSVYPVGAQVEFYSHSPVAQIGTTAQFGILWSFTVDIDTGRATPEQCTEAAVFFFAALQKLIGWEFELGREIRIAEGFKPDPSARVQPLSFGFITPVYLAG